MESYLLELLKSGMPIIIIPENFLTKKKSELQKALDERMKKPKTSSSQIIPYVA